jgi:predicted TIM-barrel fold metal-dependent hydrolase
MFYKKEGKVRIILEMLLGFKLEKAKPKWNINPRTNYALEFDGYNEEKKVAFEFQGRHHFEENIFKNTDLATVQYKDQIKRENCLVNGVKLIAINDNKNTKTTTQLFKHIVKTLETNNMSFNSEINVKQIEEKIKNAEIY